MPLHSELAVWNWRGVCGLWSLCPLLMPVWWVLLFLGRHQWDWSLCSSFTLKPVNQWFVLGGVLELMSHCTKEESEKQRKGGREVRSLGLMRVRKCLGTRVHSGDKNLSVDYLKLHSGNFWWHSSPTPPPAWGVFFCVRDPHLVKPDPGLHCSKEFQDEPE